MEAGATDFKLKKIKTIHGRNDGTSTGSDWSANGGLPGVYPVDVN
jgi:hypothetical protein